MDLGSNFSARLEPFLLMGKSVKGAAAAKLVQDATSAPGVFVFSELLQLPNIQELGKNEEHEKFLALLRLFAYKTYGDYLKHRDRLPPLNAAQLTKLKHLSIATLAADRRILPYAELMGALQMPTIRELEDLIIDAIYLDILRGKLDQKEEQFEVEYTMGRDLEPEKLVSLLAALKDWASTTAAVLQKLDENIASVTTEAATAKAKRENHEREVQTTLKELQDRNKDKSGGSNSSQNPVSGGTRVTRSTYASDRMDVDEPVEAPKGKNRKAPQQETSKPQRKRNRF
ncbi:hypothetical protein E1B28_009611 [Marasmius oreades]|uniref:PCI domain-containing protein n=1 Tax=Marasmius oreades TaxID=181124 RepID=A0A9P7UQM7_9AGAR|nr:uncharacterized protein E1B28_009611 [Marasmius oreades]KAG7090498.1 hypothetical protein E1B28_009611 [Marasmius oreades]